ncbi:MAG: carboxypeptidase-like regulatory domain-containing protein [Aeromicrobium sp.]
MKFRVSLLFPALVALVAGVLVAAPAEAASFASALKSKSIAISTAGNGKVALKCTTTSRCRGTIQFAGGGTKRTYNVKGRTTVYVPVAMNNTSAANPNLSAQSGSGVKSTSATLKISQTSPRRASKSYPVTTEAKRRSQQIVGTVNGPGGAGNVGPVRVELLSVDRGGNTKVVRFANGLNDGASFRFSIPLGPNNSSSKPYRLRIVGPTAAGDSHSWFWRGKNNKPSTGGRYLRDATVIRATKYGAFRANFRYSSIFGTAPAGTRLTIAAAPPTYAGGKDVRRELDIPSCANIYSTTTVGAGGTYQVNFLPFAPGDRRFLVAAKNDGNERWNNSFGSCLDVQNYRSSRSNMLALEQGGLNYNVAVGPSGNHVAVNGAYSGLKPTAQGDRWVSLREATPGVPILDSPIVAEQATARNGNSTFYNVPPGRYYVELGRRTGCADWYSSRYSNNKSYFKGLDRSSERWKTFSKLSALPGNRRSGFEYLARTANPNPATDAEQGSRPRGGAGWMYRTHCKALGAGAYKVINVSGLGNSTRSVSLRSKKGAIVRGKVSRAKGRTNKEMMVTLSSTDGKRVIRTDLTDGSGRFYVAGLPAGRWKITVNADSWRGIGRTFKGRHFITVKAGRTYSAGTLRFSD